MVNVYKIFTPEWERKLKFQLPKTQTTKMLTSNIQLGLCCINTELRKQDVFCSRKATLTTVEKLGPKVLIDRARQNCLDLITMIKWNHAHGIRVMRMSSEMMPQYANPKSPYGYTLDFVRDELYETGRLAREYGQRLTFHPGQYNVLATPHAEALDSTIADLTMHAEIMDAMHMDQDSVMVVHGGGTYGDKPTTKRRWIDRYLALPQPVRDRLVLENCEKSFSIVDCLEITKECRVPVVFDNLHFDCYRQLHPGETFSTPQEYMAPVLETWHLRGIKPKFHLSEQAVGGKVGKHADFITRVPDYYLSIEEPIDVMVEAKMKEQAIFRLIQK